MSLDFDIRNAIVGTLNGNVERSTSWFPYPVILAGGNFPAGMLIWTPGENTYGDTFDPTDSLLYSVELHVRGGLNDAGMVMGEYLVRGSGSAIVDALNTNSTLDGLVMDVTATGFVVAEYQGPDADYVARVNLRVMT